MIFSEEKFNEELKYKLLPFVRLNLEDGYITGYDGTRLHYACVSTPAPKAAIVISHGFTEFIPKYYEMIYYFYNAGYSVYIIEHRGHGYSDRMTEDMSMVTVKSFDDYVSDLDTFVHEVVAKREAFRPLYLYGHSMGGAIAAMYLEKYPNIFSKAILSSPMIEMLYGGYSDFAVTSVMLLSRILCWNEKYPPGQGPYSDVYDFEASNTLSEARYNYIHSCMAEDVHYQTRGSSYRWCRAARRASRFIKNNTDKIKIPVLLCQAGNDTLVSDTAQESFIEKLDGGTIKKYSIAKHEIYCASDDILERYYTDILDFWA